MVTGKGAAGAGRQDAGIPPVFGLAAGLGCWLGHRVIAAAVYSWWLLRGALPDGRWGAVAKSNYAGLRYREPVYRTLRELVMSYFDNYYNYARERTLRGYSRAVNLTRFDRIEWMTREKDVWEVPTYLCGISHVPLLTEQQERHLTRLDRRSFLAGQVGRASAPGEQR